MNTLKDLNVCSQKGLVEMFDGSIGAGSVFMPHGGKYQMTETQAMVAKLPVLKGDCDTVTMMSYGFDPIRCKDRGFRRRLLEDPVYLPGVFPPYDRRSAQMEPAFCGAPWSI